MDRYIVESPGGRQLQVEANNGEQAKRRACKAWGLRPSCPWVGVRNMRVRKIKEAQS